MLKAIAKIFSFVGLSLVFALILSWPINHVIYLSLPFLKGIFSEALVKSLENYSRPGSINSFSLVVATLVVLSIMTRREGRPVASVGFGFYSGWLKSLGLGIFLGFCYEILDMALFYCLRLFLPLSHEDIDLSIRNYFLDVTTYGLIATIVFFVLTFFLGALVEELVFRGYPFQSLLAIVGKWPTILTTSSIFVFAHYQTHSPGGLLIVGIFGLILALLYWKSRSLWMPIGFHTAHNVTTLMLGAVVGLPGRGEEWLRVASTTFIALILILGIVKHLKPSVEMEALWRQYVPIAQPWAQLKSWWARRKQAACDQTPPTS